MSLRDFAIESFERALNALIALDPDTAHRLAGLHGRVIRIDLRGTGIQLNMVPGHDGRIQLLGSIEGEPDATLTGSPIDLLRAGDKHDGHAQLFGGNVRIDGDSGVAHRFSDALAGLDIDWEEQLSHLTGDIAAHEVGRGVRATGREVRRLADNARDNLSDYLTEEARLLPHRYEVADFLDAVDTLRDDVERLDARIALLEKAAREDDAS
ncbi:MAG: SCP2 sterol-binding domain-containing protein [Gammaproteobacteria bacterium]|nr:SCP2 sterol-binding domain-containing protein [Gammaproteobacteria bacterium]MCB1925156.1 SCP2 sterol-binding domain-containing protein [Gammaproteobacteria bacterium]